MWKEIVESTDTQSKIALNVGRCDRVRREGVLIQVFRCCSKSSCDELQTQEEAEAVRKLSLSLGLDDGS